MTVQAKFSCLIIGSGTLPIQCAEILLNRGHAIRGVLTSDSSFSRWAEERSIPCSDPRHDLVGPLSKQPFDYLFSIVNEHILPTKVLDIPRKGAINYHDGPLPRYGGTHATSWAIINRERSHGITWHSMTEAVDAGHILKKTAVDILDSETAFTLNAKCYEAAIGSFDDMVHDLERGRESAVEQNLEDRTYYGRFRRPEAACTIRWHRAAEDISALVRGLDFGPYPNPLGLPKIALGGDFALVRETRVTKAKSPEPPGTITAIDSRSIKVSTETWDIELTRLQSIDGGDLPIDEFVDRYQVSPGHHLMDLDEDTADRLTAHNHIVCRHESYWLDRLSTMQPLRIPSTTFADLHTSQESRYRTMPLSIPPDLIHLSRGESQAQRWEDSLLGAFVAYLARISLSESFDIGYRDDRSEEDVAGFEGFFAPWVPLPVEVADGQSLDEVIRGIRTAVESADLQGTYARDLPSRYPLLRADGIRRGNQTWSASVHRVTSTENYEAVPGCEITLVLSDDPAECRWVYDTQVHEQDSVLGMLRQYVTLLASAATTPDRPIADLPLLSDAERNQILVDWNATELDVPEDVCIHELFEARVAEDRERAALVAQDGSLTYGELESKANRLARHLVGLGVGPETLVGVSLPRTTDMVVAVMGILKAGGAYLPLDPDLPAERLGYMLEDGGAGVLVTNTEVLESFPPFAGGVVCVDGESQAISSHSDAPLDVPVDPNHLAYVIYTSGSTGWPKGVEICHRSVVNFLIAMGERLRFSAGDILLATAPLSFDPSVDQIFGPLSYGARVVLSPEGIGADGSRLRALLEGSRISLMGAPPAIWRTLFKAGWRGDKNLRAWTGAEAVPLDLTREMVGCCAEVWHVYGPTETTLAATSWKVPEEVEEIRIGTPLGNYQVYVLDPRMKPVPVGVPGELFIGGAGVARGYRNRPELTDQQFVPNSFSEEPGARLYRTGDQVRFRDDGTLEFMGRLDDQVKIRGFRIELGEIEARLGEHESVRQVAVMVHGEGVDARLVAYPVFQEGHSLSSTEVRRFLRRSLPDYMVPSLLIELEELPLTSSGKLDRKALPDPGTAVPSEDEAFVAPRTPTEEALAGIWAEVLGREQVGVQDDFFELGGHSLLATQVMSRVAQDLEVDLPLRSLFESSTVAELAERIEAIDSGVSVSPPPIERLSREGRVPLSFAQQRLWFLDQIEERSDLYNMPLTLELRGHLDREILRRSVEAIVGRHEVLRTTFPDVDGVAYQAIAPDPGSGCWEWTETAAGGEGGGEALTEFLRVEAGRPFDMAAGPLFRVGLVRLEKGIHVLQVVMHHSVSDGWSLGVFRRELSALYTAFLAGDPSPLPPLPIQYADYAMWQKGWLQGEVLNEQLGYWREELEGLKPLDLPTDRPRPGVQSFRGGTHQLHLSSALAQGLRALSRREGSTLFMTLMAAFQLLMHRYSNQADIAVGTPIAGRNRSELEGLMGMFVNTLVVRSDLSGNPSFRELLRKVRDTSLEAHAHQDLPFEKLVEELQPVRDLGRNPLFQVMFVLQNAPDAELTLPGLEAHSLEVGGEPAKTDLAVSLWETAVAGEAGRGIEGSWVYATDLFDARTIERMQGHFDGLLEEIVANPDRPIADLPLLSDAERNQILVEWNATELDVPKDVCIHELFEARVAEDRERVALVAKDGCLTYGELESKANRLARHLMELGVGPETLVGVSLPRTTDMVVAVMGILKAGGAYLPLDPDLPAERLGYMLEDGGAAVLVTNTEVLESFPPFAGGVVCVDEERQVISSHSDAPLNVPVGPNHLAYVIYTSGSTGRPKGVEVCHRNVADYLFSLRKSPGLSTDDVVLAAATLSFDVSVMELFGPLSLGGRVVLASWEVVRDGGRLRALLEETGVTVGNCTPATWYMLLEAGWRGDKNLRVWVGGEAVPLDLTKKLVGCCGEVWNVYGPAEATVTATAWKVPKDVEQIRIGTPLRNYQVYVLDSRMRPLPVGVPGELYIGGVGVARGYRNHPELTAERFVPDLFSERPEGRMYRTGDRVRFRDDGTLEFMGRLDNQVKIRGVRIELGEIEARLGEHESVRQVAVMIHGEGVRARLVAYVVFEEGQGLTSTEVRRFLRQFLPDYMVPGLIIELDELPLSPSGKTDREALPDPLSRGDERTRTYHRPETPEEALIVGVWRDLLEIDRVSRTDNFYEIGGHSLLSIRAVSEIEKLTGRKLDPRRMFFQTVEQLARSLVGDPK